MKIDTIKHANYLLKEIEDINKTYTNLDLFFTNECEKSNLMLIVETKNRMNSNWNNNVVIKIDDFSDIIMKEKIQDELMRCAEACKRVIDKHAKALEKELEDLK